MKYMGSKNRLAKELAPIIQSYITNETKGYLEPFVGGANMIDKINFSKKYGCDINEYLIELLEYSKNNSLPETVTKETYDNVKKNKSNFPKWYVGLVGFCASYNGKWFGGYANNVNTKIGTVRNYTDESIKNLSKQSLKLKEIIFKHCSFLDIEPSISGYVIYCDPPYRGTTKYKTEEFPYDKFYEWCNEMSKSNIILVSEYSMPNNFECIWSKSINISMDNKRCISKDKSKRTEKLFILRKGE